MKVRDILEMTASPGIVAMPMSLFGRVMRRFSKQQEKDDVIGFLDMVSKKKRNKK